ncbi:unnamed protein product [Calypogeia fissa]
MADGRATADGQWTAMADWRRTAMGEVDGRPTSLGMGNKKARNSRGTGVGANERDGLLAAFSSQYCMAMIFESFCPAKLAIQRDVPIPLLVFAGMERSGAGMGLQWSLSGAGTGV